jgi:hypothetical protein
VTVFANTTTTRPRPGLTIPFIGLPTTVAPTTTVVTSTTVP